MKEGFISTLQSYSTKDGPGIRTTVFCIGCNLRCAWCANPELMLPGEKYMYFKQRCIRCGSCIKHCHGEISMAENGCVINRANIDMDTLRQCEDVCPKSAYEKVGTRITSAALAQKLLRDKEFYTVSGGGVTFSGGEAGLQADFVYETAKLLRKEGVPVTLDTAGLIKWDILSHLLEEIDLVLYDIKSIDEQIHKKCTGVSNQLILDNAKKIADIPKPMWIRMVLVPDWNDDLHDIKKRFEFIKSLGPAVKRVDVLKYHTLGEGKYYSLGMEYPIAPGTVCSDEFIDKVSEIADMVGVPINIEN